MQNTLLGPRGTLRPLRSGPCPSVLTVRLREKICCFIRTQNADNERDVWLLHIKWLLLGIKQSDPIRYLFIKMNKKFSVREQLSNEREWRFNQCCEDVRKKVPPVSFKASELLHITHAKS